MCYTVYDISNFVEAEPMQDEDRKDNEAMQNLPRGIALSWGLEKEPQRGPKRELSIRKIVDTAIQIADKDGLSAVSMNRVAASLGYTAMSLYRYIPSKEDLLLLMQDAVCDIPIPPEEKDEDWKTGMREYVQACIQILREHPWFFDIPITGEPYTPNILQIVEWGLRIMRHCPLSDHEKMSIVLLLNSYARSWGGIIRDIDKAVQAGSRSAAPSTSDIHNALKYLVTQEQFPQLYAMVKSGTYAGENESDDGSNDFEFGLERILDGIEYYLNQRQAENGK